MRTLLDFVRYATSRFVEAKLTFAHGTTDPVAEAAFLVCETLHLHPDQFDSFATARVTAIEGKKILDLIARRIATRKPAAYLVNKIYMRGLPFYIDERAIVPRSFIGELLDSHFSGQGNQSDDDRRRWRLADRRSRKCCERARPLLPVRAVSPSWPRATFRNAQIDAVDISRDALDGRPCAMVADYGLAGPGGAASRRSVCAAIGGKRYDLIITNPPYVDALGMAALPRECRAEPKLAFDGGADGLDIVRRILQQAPTHI